MIGVLGFDLLGGAINFASAASTAHQAMSAGQAQAAAAQTQASQCHQFAMMAGFSAVRPVRGFVNDGAPSQPLAQTYERHSNWEAIDDAKDAQLDAWIAGLHLGRHAA